MMDDKFGGGWKKLHSDTGTNHDEFQKLVFNLCQHITSHHHSSSLHSSPSQNHLPFIARYGVP
jgi:hypothetical protein